MQNGVLAIEEQLVGFHLLFDKQVAVTPDRTAVIHEGTQWTYQQLRDQSDAIASCLKKRFVQAEERIGICLDRSPAAISAMIGIMKAGGAFVPLDPELPRDRLRFILDDAGIHVVLCSERYKDLFEDCEDIQAVILEYHVDEEESPSEVNQICWDPVEVEPEQLAYVMYTSGSTGKPKGVMIQHHALATYCWADIDVYHLMPDDRTLHFSTINFDISIEEIFPPLLTGGAVVIRNRQRSESHNELTDLIRSYGITAIHLATAYWHEWVDLMIANREIVPESLRLMVVTGEKVSVQHYERWKKICHHPLQWSNAYGPTEATVSATVFTPDPDWSGESMPIGFPLKRYEAYILDEKLVPLEQGSLGELVIAGPALARGYLNRPELTEKAFVEICWPDGQRRRIYRTGDLARIGRNGTIEFFGRMDHQIKLGSYRIEPGEIESAIQQYQGVLEALVLHEQIGASKYLVAYIARGEDKISPKEVQDHLRDLLPGYMIPQRFLFLDRFPKTINGKVDRPSLPPAHQAQTVQPENDDRELDTTEQQLAEMWQEVLQVRSIGPTDNFFFLGGSSLLVTRLVTKIKERFDTQLPVRDVFANPTLEGLAAYLTALPSISQSLAPNNSNRAARPWIPKIQASFIESDDETLFAICYPPKRTSRNHTVVICPALGHEYSRSHRNLQQLALMLASAGYETIRFDYSFTGNSSGECVLGSIEQWKKDITAICKHFSDAKPDYKLSVIGLRWGATLAANNFDIAGNNMILWDPIFSGARYLKLLKRFSKRTLKEYVRFPVRRVSTPDQLYGLTASLDLQQSLGTFRIPEGEHAGFERNFVILSNQYLRNEVGEEIDLGLARNTTVVESKDEIMWHQPEFTESAFASPNTFRIIFEMLGQETE